MNNFLLENLFLIDLSVTFLFTLFLVLSNILINTSNFELDSLLNSETHLGSPLNFEIDEVKATSS